MLVNTSFNVRGEPIVCTPDDAYRCFMRTEMDFLVIGDYVLEKADQPPFVDEAWKPSRLDGGLQGKTRPRNGFHDRLPIAA